MRLYTTVTNRFDMEKNSYTQTFVQFITMSQYFGCFHLFPHRPPSCLLVLIGYMHKNCKHSWINKADRDLLFPYHIKAFSVITLYCILLSAYSSSGFLKHFAQFIFFAAESSLPQTLVYVLSFHYDLCFLRCIYVLNINSELLILALFWQQWQHGR